MPTIRTIVKRLLDSEAGRRQPVAVLSRLAWWQLWRRGMRQSMSFKTVTGSRLMLLPGASDSLSGFWYHQIPDFEEMAFALHLLCSDDLFVDVGANQGGWSLIAAGHGARVIAFEPVPLTRARFLANIGANPPAVRQRIQILPFGLSDQNAKVSFTANLDAGNHRVRDRAETVDGEILVDLVCADDVLRDENPVLIKIDVEGEELGVLKGGRKILTKPSLRAVIMETFRPNNYAMPALIESETILREHGFLPTAYEPWKRILAPLNRSSDGGQNTIYVRNHPEVAALLKQSEPIGAFGTAI